MTRTIQIDDAHQATLLLLAIRRLAKEPEYARCPAKQSVLSKLRERAQAAAASTEFSASAPRAEAPPYRATG